MNKKEFKIGEKFQCGLTTLECVKQINKYCEGCVFYDGFGRCVKFMTCVVGECKKHARSDHNNVIFKQVKNE